MGQGEGERNHTRRRRGKTRPAFASTWLATTTKWIQLRGSIIDQAGVKGPLRVGTLRRNNAFHTSKGSGGGIDHIWSASTVNPKVDETTIEPRHKIQDLLRGSSHTTFRTPALGGEEEPDARTQPKSGFDPIRFCR